MDWAALSSQWLPSATVCVAYFVLFELRFENQRWTKEIASGTRGNSDAIVAFAIFTQLVATVFAVAVFAFLAWYAGWRVAIGLIVATFVVSTVWSMTIGLLFRDNWVIHALATLAVWPTSVFIATTLAKEYW
jgi:uncharacterized membrane protein